MKLLTSDFMHNQAKTIQNQAKTEEAVACYQKLLLQPDRVEAVYELGNTLQAQMRLDEAIVCYRKTIEMVPDSAAAHFNLGNALLSRGMLAESVLCYKNAVRIVPDMAEAYCNMATAFKELGLLDEALSMYQKAVSLKPNYIDAYNNLGNVFHQTGHLHEAKFYYRKSIRIAPDNACLWNNLGNICKDQGRITKAIQFYRKALEVLPQYAEAHSNLLFAMHYDSRVENRDIFLESKTWWQQHGAPRSGKCVHVRGTDLNKRIRVGYVSPDFRDHSVSYFVIPLLEGHSERFETFCYSETKRPDKITKRIRTLSNHWRSITGLSDDHVAQRIFDDKIDILVDLAGHTERSRLMVFARKPAPIQMTWLGYPNTTGMPVMDYRLTDDIADPVGEADQYHTERLIRLPHGFLCYKAPEEAGSVSSLPAMQKRKLTFGSFNNLCKVNQNVIRIWSTLLKRLPESTLLLKSKQLQDKDTEQHYLEMFSNYGISTERIQLAAYVRNKIEHLSLYNKVDIALDPFPYNGTTTTCEALWMGVPVITQKGNRHASRVGASILTHVGLEKLVAETDDAYVDTAVQLAGDLEKLAEMRRGMRTRLRNSALCNMMQFSKEVEDVYRKLWQNWCEQSGASGEGNTFRPKVGIFICKEKNREKITPDNEKVTVIGTGEFKRFFQMGVSFQLKGCFKQAIEYYRKAMALEPRNTGALNNMGIAYQALGDFNVARLCFQKAIGLDSKYVDAYINLGNLFQHQQQLDAAISCYKKAIKISPNLSEAYNNLGNILMQRGMLDEAINCYEKGIHFRPENAEVQANMGNALQSLGKYPEAVDCYGKAIKINPDNSATHNNMGAALKALGRLREAASSLREAIRIDPNNAESYNNLGSVLKHQGKICESLACYRKALTIKPGFAVAHSNLLFAMHYDPRVGNRELFAEASSWWKEHGISKAERFAHPHHQNLSGRLRVGYVSPDFREHSVSFFFLPLLEAHNPDRVETFCYSDVKWPDRVTARLKERADHWQSIVGLTDGDVAEKIFHDRIDILVDLAGHTADNRLLVFARKPAPIQVTWLGYPNTTGMPVMNYRFTDEIADPLGEADSYYTEQLIRLQNGFLCYAPPEGIEKTSDLPVIRRGKITFGSFNNLPKINDQVIKVWAEILNRVPDSCLLLKSKPLKDSNTRQCYLEMFLRYGISPDRIQMEASTRTIGEHLDCYRKVDIGLDPFPYNGATTTCEALWMGVPVLTLKGNRHSSRVGASILTQVQFENLISQTEEEYVQKAVELASDHKRLRETREQMREMLKSSKLYNARSFAGGIEDAYQKMWESL